MRRQWQVLRLVLGEHDGLLWKFNWRHSLTQKESAADGQPRK